MQKKKAGPSPAYGLTEVPEDTRDCLQCLIVMYGDTHIDTLAKLLSLTSYAETVFSHLCRRRLR